MDIQLAPGLKDEKHLRNSYLQPALEAKLIEMTIPEKPQSRLQKYRLTAKGWRKVSIP
ncbi:MAG: Fic family protein [Duganella sp.]